MKIGGSNNVQIFEEVSINYSICFQPEMVKTLFLPVYGLTRFQFYNKKLVKMFQKCEYLLNETFSYRHYLGSSDKRIRIWRSWMRIIIWCKSSLKIIYVVWASLNGATPPHFLLLKSFFLLLEDILSLWLSNFCHVISTGLDLEHHFRKRSSKFLKIVDICFLPFFCSYYAK